MENNNPPPSDWKIFFQSVNNSSEFDSMHWEKLINFGTKVLTCHFYAIFSSFPQSIKNNI